MSTRAPSSDFATESIRDLRSCTWWRPLEVAVAGEPREQGREAPALGSFADRLLDAFRDQGHTVLGQPTGRADLMLGFAEIPEGPGSLAGRIEERSVPLAVALTKDLGLQRRPEHLVALVAVPEPLAGRSHLEVVETARAAMARIGAPKVVLVSMDRSGRVQEATYCTMEGGHPSDRERIPERLRDRLVAGACAREVGADYEVIEAGLPAEAWKRSDVPDALVRGGQRMDRLGLLPVPKRIDEYVSSRLSRLYERFLGLKGWSEGMLFAVDPETGTTMVTASGSWDVDKRALRREEVVPIGGASGGRLTVLAPDGMSPKGPSVEAWEVWALLEAVPKVRVSRSADGGWHLDPNGPVEVPIVRGGIHAHVGVTEVDESVIETVPANREAFPYGFGCGTDLMCEVVRDVASRSRAMTDPEDPRLYVRWPMLYHGETAVELWKPGLPSEPLRGLLDLYESGTIGYTPDHIEQPT